MARRERGEEFWESAARRYMTRECTQDEFCRRLGVNASTLQYHLTRIKEKRERFLPVEIPSEPEIREVMLEFPGGFRLSIRG